MRAFIKGDRVRVTNKARLRYGKMSMPNGTVVGFGAYRGVHVLHDDGWKDTWKSEALELVGILEDLASAIEGMEEP